MNRKNKSIYLLNLKLLAILSKQLFFYICSIINSNDCRLVFINSHPVTIVLLKLIKKIFFRLLLTLFVLVYVTIALLNYSVVQSVVASVASDYFTSEWGGKVRIGSLGCNPMNHLVLRNVELIAPGNDTVCVARKMSFRFNGFPFDSHGLSFSKIELHDTYYHLTVDSVGLNLDFIINYYDTGDDDEEDDDEEEPDFKVLVDDLVLDNVRYSHDLEDSRPPEQRLWEPGVDVLHMDYREISAHFRNVRVDLDRVTCRIDRFSTNERSGLQVKQLQGNVYVTRSGISTTNLYLETADSKVIGDVLLDYRDWDSMSEFLDSVYFTVHLDEGSYGGMQDAAYWAHDLWGMDHHVDLQGNFSGFISDFRAEDFKLTFGDESALEFDAYMYGLPDIDTTIIGAEIHRLHTTYSDLAAVRHPAGIKMQAEKLIKALNNIDLEASFTGTIRDFYATFSLLCDQGNLSGDLLMAMNPEKGNYRYTGQFSSSGFNLGRLAPNEWVSRAGFDLTVEGNGFEPKTMNAFAEGQLHHIVVKGQRLISEVAVEADATGGLLSFDASIDDVLASLSVHGEGDWREDHPVYRANVDVQHLDLNRFGLWYDPTDSIARVSFHASARHSMTDDANHFSRLSLTDVNLLTIGHSHPSDDTDVRHNLLHIKDFTLSSRQQNHWMNTTLRSDIADANLRGYYKYASLPLMLTHIVDDYLPDALKNSNISDNQKDKNGIEETLATSRLEFNLEWKDTAALLRHFLPQLYIAPGSTIQANYNFADGFKPIIRSDSVSWGNIRFFDIGINAEAVADHYQLQMKSDRLLLGNLQLMDRGTIRVESSRQAIGCRLLWQNSSQTVSGGDVSLRLLADSSLLHLVVDPSHLALGGRDWQLLATGDNYFSPSLLHVDGISLLSDNQKLTLESNLAFSPNADPNRPADPVGDKPAFRLLLSNLGLDIINPFLAVSGISLGGHANGQITQSQVTTGDLRIVGLAFNGQQLGDMVIHSFIDDSLNRLNFNAQSEPSLLSADTGFSILLDGFTALSGDSPELFVDADVDNLSLSVIQPFVNSFSSRVDGRLSADLALRGSVNAPDLSGSLALQDGFINVDFTNVAYRFSDTILISRDTIHINDFHISDPKGNPALLNGTISHHNFKNIRLNLLLDSPQLLCMNTGVKDNPDFYGSILASADGRIRGPIDNLNIVLNATTLQGTSLTVPITDKRQMEQVDYIHFLSDEYDEPVSFDHLLPSAEPTALQSPSDASASNSSRFSLTINVDVTPDMLFRLPMDFSSVTVDVLARGDGDLQLSLGTGRDFGVAGLYEISGGTLNLDLLGVVSKEFNIDDGSSITLPGSYENSLFDIRAVLNQRVNLSSLTGNLSSTDSQKQVQVENVISLSGTLQSPNVSFDIRLPGADQSVVEEVFSYIDRNNERDMLNQTVSLLVSKRFYNPSAAEMASSSSTGDQAYGIVMGTIGSMISDMVQFVDVNFDYQSGNALTTDQYAVDISKQWNKFYFETSFGFGGESREMLSSSDQGTNNMTGDMLVGYKLNPHLHLFVFNRSNTNDYTRSDLPYKQGLGLKYTRDFDRFRDFFNFKKKKNKR